VAGISSYVASLSYTELGQPHQYQLDSNPNLFLTDTWDPQTGWLTRAQVTAGTATVDDMNYSYDAAGNVLSEADTPASGPAQVQCFTYNYLAQLQTAWSQSAASCSAGPSQTAESTAAAPYWDQYSYDTEGNLTGITQTPASGNATTITDAFGPSSQPGGTGPAGPHQIGTQSVQTPGVAQPAVSTYGWDTSGRLTSIASPSGTEQFSWGTPSGGPVQNSFQLSQISQGTDTTKYVYDASGNLLQQTDDGTATLYLPGEEITSTNGTLSGVRYYSLGGMTVAARATFVNSAGVTTSGVQYLIGDQQGTDTLAIDSQTLAVTRRYYDPYGNPVGAASSNPWPGNTGFAGGTDDALTGLTNLGAREYNAGTGSFTSPDAVLSPYQPQDLNPYAYAYDNPSTNSDPTGLVCAPGASANANCNNPPVQAPPPPTYSYTAGNIFISTTSLPVLVKAVVRVAKQIGIFWYPGGDTGTTDITDPQFEYAIAQSVCASHPNWCTVFPQARQSGVEKMLQAIGIVLMGGIGEGEGGEDPVPADATPGETPEVINGGMGPLVKVNKPDAGADTLAEIIDGESTVKFANDPLGREFDAVNDEYIGQAKPGLTLSKSFRVQAKATFEMSIVTGRTPYFYFESEPGQGVLGALQRYSARYDLMPVVNIGGVVQPDF
jgi:RHS repeat-associated protein